MIADMFKQFLEKLYPWHFHVAGAIVLLALLMFFWYTFVGINKFTKTTESILEFDNKLQNFRDERDKIKEENQNNQAISGFLFRVVHNIKPFLDTLNEIRITDDPRQRATESSFLIQRTLDSLTSDIKIKAGDHHRCCVWSVDDRLLRPVVISAGFPTKYKETRSLDLDRSIAGRSYRTSQILNISDVTQDTDWARNDVSRSRYNALICVPLNRFGVLTVDGMGPMNNECLHVVELYASIIQGALNEYFLALPYTQSEPIDEDDVVSEENVS